MMLVKMCIINTILKLAFLNLNDLVIKHVQRETCVMRFSQKSKNAERIFPFEIFCDNQKFSGNCPQKHPKIPPPHTPSASYRDVKNQFDNCAI